MHAIRFAVRTLALAAVAGAMGSCSDGAPTRPEPQGPDFIAVVGGSGQEAEVGTELPQPLVVEVRDAGDQPVAGVTVEWSSTTGGQPNPASSTTDASGRASTRWTLSTAAAVNTVAATVSGTSISVRMDVRAHPGPPAQLRVLPDSFTTYFYSPWSSVQAAVSDRYGNPVPGLLVGWTALEPQYADLVDQAGYTVRIDPVYPGRARMVARTGTVADTVVVRVVHDVLYLHVTPVRLRAMVGDSISFSAIGLNPELWVRWAPVSWSVEGSGLTLVPVDSARAVGRVTAPGRVQVQAVLGWDPVRVGVVEVEGVTSSNWASVSGGETHTCGVTTAGLGYCWGQNFNEFLATDAPDYCPGALCNTAPMPVRGGLAFESIAPGSLATCGITTSGRTFCWGHNYSGQLGTGSTSQLTVRAPEEVAGGHRFVRLTLGGSHSCGLDEQGRAYCWGGNAWGELGTGLSAGSATPVLVAGGHTWKHLEAGNQRTCGITTADQSYCWGAWLATVPARVPQDPGFTTIAAGWEHQCGLTAAGQAYCWGFNNHGELGRGSTELSSDTVPRPVLGGHRFVAIAAGDSFTCALDAAGAAFCWGVDDDGELGNGGENVAAGAPTRVAGGRVFRSVTAGREHACATTADGSAFCWGRNYSGPLGNGTRDDASTPTRVSVP